LANRLEAGETQGAFGARRRNRVAVVEDLLEAGERLGLAEIDRVDADVPLGRPAAEHLDRRRPFKSTARLTTRPP